MRRGYTAQQPSCLVSYDLESVVVHMRTLHNARFDYGWCWVIRSGHPLGMFTSIFWISGPISHPSSQCSHNSCDPYKVDGTIVSDGHRQAHVPSTTGSSFVTYPRLHLASDRNGWGQYTDTCGDFV
ncbi:predicted protein [Plenodomus lingam JN3]|uniref:Predicted protein n=1 Tax=Leptosphaeria maculans (strain JN3 / isolate v23.1.3 / race Av1-4-5-6-7-8) TaxID=985895 RepID=E4ZS90_LEPMJ|nr:predicted protein [Plenodomus lingam JN3]CBX94270.1 predicted protein [Plenodomus lingam JN3]